MQLLFIHPTYKTEGKIKWEPRRINDNKAIKNAFSKTTRNQFEEKVFAQINAARPINSPVRPSKGCFVSDLQNRDIWQKRQLTAVALNRLNRLTNFIKNKCYNQILKRHSTHCDVEKKRVGRKALCVIFRGEHCDR